MTGADAEGRRWHDMGGAVAAEGDAGVNRDTHDYALWEKRVDALMVLATSKGLFSVDGLRRVLEDMGPEVFETQSYYERWIQAVTQNLMEAGAFTPSELGVKMDEVAARGATYGECSLGS